MAYLPKTPHFRTRSFVLPRFIGNLLAIALLILTLGATYPLFAQVSFIHPGGLHTMTDLNRMKDKVAAGEHPWIDSWTALCANPKAQFSYQPHPLDDMDRNRQIASADAVAAYLNTIRWYISGDTRYADCAVRICNAWSSKISVVHAGFEGGLMGIPAYEFAVAGEVLRTYPDWSSSDFARFQNMLEVDIYPSCHDFLVRHDGLPITHYWANWDLCNMISILSIGVLCDDRPKFDEAIEYFKHGKGNGSIEHAIPYLYKNGLAQWQESGRDQEHTQLGVGMMAMFCQIAWNQGIDLYSYDNNRLLAAAEYVARYNMWEPVPYTFYNNEDSVNQYWISDLTGLTGARRGVLQRPIWELIYNHYVVLKGLNAPNVKAMADLYRPEGFEHDDNFGFGTLLYTLDAAKSPYPPAEVPPVPVGVGASASVGKVYLHWDPSETADGYVVQRSSDASGPFTELANYHGAFPLYLDATAANGSAWYYRVAAKNQRGVSEMSTVVSATPVVAGPLPADWTLSNIGSCAMPGDANFASVSGGTISMTGSGGGLGLDSSPDGLAFVYKHVTGNFTFTARRISSKYQGGSRQRIGIAVRQSEDTSSPAVAMVSGDLGTRLGLFGVRPVAGGPTTWQFGDGYTTDITWFRIRRTQHVFTAYQSVDGLNWFAVGSPVTPLMSDPCLVGLAVSSNSDKISSATFDNLSITPDR
jgi:hypothetical protein